MTAPSIDSESRTKWHRWLPSGRPRRSSFILTTLIVAALIATAGAVAVRAQGTPETASPPAGGGQTRNITIVTVPLLVKEMEPTLDFLTEAFAEGDVLEGKEVYAFSPSTIVVNQGDTIELTVVNGEDDDHTFTAPDLGIDLTLDPLSQTKTTIEATEPGIYQFICNIPSHLPYMWGQIVVLPAGTTM